MSFKLNNKTCQLNKKGKELLKQKKVKHPPSIEIKNEHSLSIDMEGRASLIQ